MVVPRRTNTEDEEQRNGVGRRRRPGFLRRAAGRALRGAARAADRARSRGRGRR